MHILTFTVFNRSILSSGRARRTRFQILLGADAPVAPFLMRPLNDIPTTPCSLLAVKTFSHCLTALCMCTHTLLKGFVFFSNFHNIFRSESMHAAETCMALLN